MLKESSLKVGPLLGEGLNAYVYKAVSNSKEFGVQQVFAIKVIKRKSDLKHFKKEFNNLLSAEGKHLVKLYGWTKHKKKPALLLEFIDGVDLERLFENYTLTNEESNWIYHEVIAGLVELNNNKLFHGDLSPKNIMITNKAQVKLIDFGLTRWRTKQIEVTPEFVAPEILDGAQPIFKHDYYSLNKIFERFKLYKNEIAPTQAPVSLLEKINLLSVPAFKTKNLTLNKPLILKKRLKFAAVLMSLFAFFKPINAKNITPGERSLFVRSKNWLSIKADHQKNWCFTPCKIQLPSNGTHTINWKSKNDSGSTKVFINNDQTTLFLKVNK